MLNINERDSFFVCGDWHGNVRWAQYAIMTMGKLYNTNENISPIVYHVGDFGVWGGAEGSAYLLLVQQTLEEQGLTLRVILGNHENYDLLEDQLVKLDSGFNAIPDFSRIQFVDRAYVWTDENTDIRFGSVGGAGSVDVLTRKQGESWWKQEEITREDIDVFKNLVSENDIRYVEVFLSHDAPAGIPVVKGGGAPWITPNVVNYCEKQRVLLRDALDMCAPSLAIYGHWHQYSNNTLSGVSLDDNNIDYSVQTVGLDMDGSQHNVILVAKDKEESNFIISLPFVNNVFI